MTSSRWLQLLPVVAIAAMLHLGILMCPIVLASALDGIGEDVQLTSFLLLMCVWCVLEGTASSHAVRPPAKTACPKWLPHAMGLTLLLVFWASLFDAALRLPVPCGWTAVAGIVLMIIGIAMRYAAIRTLGRFFLNEVALLPNHPLVTHGIYGSLRHPSELGTICLASGGTVLLGSMNGIVICAVVLVPLVIWRTRLEDALLRRRYPLAFHGYSSKVSAFLPMIRPIQSWLDAEM